MLKKDTPIFWKGYCNKDRNTAIFEIENIAANHGFITDFRRYSDIEVCIRVEIETKKISGLYKELTTCLALDENKDIQSDWAAERTIFLNITFTKGSGNLKIEVPAIPG